jgi:hypothetical protein
MHGLLRLEQMKAGKRRLNMPVKKQDKVAKMPYLVVLWAKCTFFHD